MGSSCCHAESPCGSAEERSGLLKDDSKATVPAGGTVVVGTCGPEGDDDMRLTPDVANIKAELKAEDVQVKRSPEAGVMEASNTQENGALQEAAPHKATPSPRKLKENSTRAQDEDVKDPPADGGQAELLPCTLNSLQKAEWEAFTATNAAPDDETRASTQEKIPDIRTAETIRPENTETTGEDIAATRDAESEDSGAAAEEEFPQDNLALAAADSEPAAAECRSSSVVSQESGRETSCDVSSSPLKEAGPEITKSHDVSESSSGSDPTGLNRSGEERDAASSVGEPETTTVGDASASSKSDQDPAPEPAISKEDPSLESIKQDSGDETTVKEEDKRGDVLQAEEKTESTEADEDETREEQLAGSASTEEMTSGPEKNESVEDGLGKSEEDLYRGAEELSASQEDESGLETTPLKEDRCSLAPAVDILSYSEREWKGNTAKSALIRKGYKEMSQRFGSLRRVRGDNYCALRATLFQVLSHSTRLPAWLQDGDVTTLPKHLEVQDGLVGQWLFPAECLQGDGAGDATLQLQGYMERLRNKWQAAVDCSSAAERQQLCERAFQGGEEELGLLEALKLLMLGRAAELHGCMRAGADVPLFCWLLFARDSSDCPRSFLSNHLGHVGLSAGLEQVEMFLLGYALQCTIQVYRLYKADTEEFVTYYPDDHKDDWPSVCLVTEDDRHYNVPVVDAAEREELDSS